MGWTDPADGESFMWKLIGRGKRTVVLDLKTEAGLDAMLRLVDTADVLVENFRPGHARAPRPRARRCSSRATPGLVVLRVTGFGQDGPYARRPGLRDHRRGDERVRGDQRRARRRAAAPADRAHRRDRRARRRVRGDGRAAPSRPHRRGSGRRREPARVDAAVHGRAAERVRAPRLPAAATRRRDPVLGPARHLPVPRRRVGRAVDVGRERRRAGARPRSASATTHASRRSPAGPSTATSSRRSSATWIGGARLGRRAPRVRRRARRDRARLLDGRRPRRRARRRRAGASSRSTASGCRA